MELQSLRGLPTLCSRCISSRTGEGRRRSATMVIESCVTIVRESERQRGPHMVAARCLCAPRVCGVLVACASMARFMFVIAFAVCVFRCVPVPVLYCALWYTSCDMSSGRRLSCATWARGSVVSIRVGRERDLERVRRGHRRPRVGMHNRDRSDMRSGRDASRSVSQDRTPGRRSGEP